MYKFDVKHNTKGVYERKWERSAKIPTGLSHDFVLYKLIYERKIILIKNGTLNNPLTIRMIYKYINSVMDNKAVNYTWTVFVNNKLFNGW
jgi:hypothetical protein